MTFLWLYYRWGFCYLLNDSGAINTCRYQVQNTFKGKKKPCFKFGQNGWCLRKGRWYSLEAVRIHPWCMMVGWIQSGNKVGTGVWDWWKWAKTDRQREKRENMMFLPAQKTLTWKWKPKEGGGDGEGVFILCRDPPTWLAFTAPYFRLSGYTAAQVVLRRYSVIVV